MKTRHQHQEEENMDAMEAILSRRSIRKYTAQPVPDEVVTGLLKAAMSAPSASNQQSWQFVVINDRHTLDEIPNIHSHSKMLKEAAVAILVCGDQRLEKSKGFWVQDCSAATQNLLIAAQAKGLGAVWLGIYPRQKRVAEFQKKFGLPEGVVPLALVSIGYPAEEKPPSNRYDPARVHYNRWS
jgi:nitroreductase